MFNRKFEEDYPHVSKPLICNGLKAITPFRPPLNMEQLQAEEESTLDLEENILPQPEEPEPEIESPQANP
tara:strand:- start:2000 stop:2209 length:210 start_codon:yes stop_codon:yes gene_type:complete